MDGYYQPHLAIHHEYDHCPSNLDTSISEPSTESHRAAIMALFLNEGFDFNDLLSPYSVVASDFNIDLVLDDQGHTALHWAAALSNIPLLDRLLKKVHRSSYVV